MLDSDASVTQQVLLRRSMNHRLQQNAAPKELPHVRDVVPDRYNGSQSPSGSFVSWRYDINLMLKVSFCFTHAAAVIIIWRRTSLSS